MNDNIILVVNIKKTMEYVYGNAKQKDTRAWYVSGPCQCGRCSVATPYQPCKVHNNISDWKIGSVKCCDGFCTWQSKCVPVEKRDQCQIGNSSTGKNPFVDVNWYKKAPNIQCKFKPEDIDTQSQIYKFIDKFGVNDELMRYFCGQAVSQCPDKETACSRMKSTAPGSRLCRDWYAKRNPQERDAFMQNYCIDHKTRDCNCVNRSTDPIYKLLKQAKVINDGCWYVPCANPSKFFVPSQLVNPTCPKNVCDIIFQFIKDKKIDIDHVKNDINCSFSPPPEGYSTVTIIILVVVVLLFTGAVILALL